MKKLYIVLLGFIGFIFVACHDSSSSSGEAQYEVTFTGLWQDSTFATNFLSNAHFSPLIGATHDSNTHLFQNGSLSSAGVIEVAETGKTTTITDEINALISSSNAEFLLKASGLPSGTSQTSFTFFVNSSNPYVSFLSMLAPSPDWFVGINALNLLDNGVWLESKTINLTTYDAGSDSGSIFTSVNTATSPKENITKLTTTASDSDFDEGFHRNDNTKAIAKIVITKIN